MTLEEVKAETDSIISLHRYPDSAQAHSDLDDLWEKLLREIAADDTNSFSALAKEALRPMDMEVNAGMGGTQIGIIRWYA